MPYLQLPHVFSHYLLTSHLSSYLFHSIVSSSYDNHLQLLSYYYSFLFINSLFLLALSSSGIIIIIFCRFQLYFTSPPDPPLYFYLVLLFLLFFSIYLVHFLWFIFNNHAYKSCSPSCCLSRWNVKAGRIWNDIYFYQRFLWVQDTRL